MSADSDFDDDDEVGYLTQAKTWIKGTFDSVKSSGWAVRVFLALMLFRDAMPA